MGTIPQKPFIPARPTRAPVRNCVKTRIYIKLPKLESDIPKRKAYTSFYAETQIQNTHADVERAPSRQPAAASTSSSGPNVPALTGRVSAGNTDAAGGTERPLHTTRRAEPQRPTRFAEDTRPWAVLVPLLPTSAPLRPTAHAAMPAGER